MILVVAAVGRVVGWPLGPARRRPPSSTRSPTCCSSSGCASSTRSTTPSTSSWSPDYDTAYVLPPGRDRVYEHANTFSNVVARGLAAVSISSSSTSPTTTRTMPSRACRGTASPASTTTLRRPFAQERAIASHLRDFHRYRLERIRRDATAVPPAPTGERSTSAPSPSRCSPCEPIGPARRPARGPRRRSSPAPAAPWVAPPCAASSPRARGCTASTATPPRCGARRTRCGDAVLLRAVDLRDAAAVRAAVAAAARRSSGGSTCSARWLACRWCARSKSPTTTSSGVQMAVNFTAVFHCCRAVVPAMKAAGGGAIVNVVSELADRRSRRVHRLLRQQGRRAGVHARARRRAGPGGHPRQRALSGSDRHPDAARRVRHRRRPGR